MARGAGRAGGQGDSHEGAPYTGEEKGRGALEVGSYLGRVQCWRERGAAVAGGKGSFVGTGAGGEGVFYVGTGAGGKRVAGVVCVGTGAGGKGVRVLSSKE